ncbi:MAG: hypothetical protein HY739_12870 [Desulfobacterales bacterium]|nr:hypothetical protein [Desulfobacterales bacterium]
MSLFWKYFKDTLRWPLIWKPGPLSVIVKGAALVLDDVRDSILWLRSQFKPETCEKEYIVRFARSRGIRRYNLETDDEKFKQRVIDAYAWQMLGGGIQGLPKILEQYGYICNKIVNVRHFDPDRWAEFRPEVTLPENEGFKEEDFDLIPFIVNDWKPARSKIDTIVMHVGTRSVQPTIVSCINSGEAITVYPWNQTEAELSGNTPYVGMAIQAVETITVNPLEA